MLSEDRVEVSLGLAFVAGVISFISPCVLALVPVYLAYLSETAGALGAIDAQPTGGALARVGSQPVIRQIALFTLSFGLIFVLLGTSVGFLGASLFRLVPFAREATGSLVIVVGLLMTGLFGPVLTRIGPIGMGRLPQTRSARSFALGGLFALGWSPCIGPVLGTILAMGASSQQVGVAALLLAFYSMGLAVPFLVAGAALPQLTPLMTALRRWHRPIEIASGLFVVAMGVLIFLNIFARMASLFTFLI